MKRILLMIAAVVLTGMLLLGTPTLAHHMPNTNEKFTSQSGDPAYFDDAGECMDLVSGDQHCVVLYGHMFDLLNPVPINIQRPSPDCQTMARGFTSTPPVEPYWSFNRQDLYSSAGFVEYDGDCDDPRIHPERGLSSDVNVAQDVPIKGYWYMSADDAEVNAIGVGTSAQDTMGGVMPCITVRMELWTERFVGSGEALAIGQTTKTVVSTPYGQGQEADTPAPQPPCPDGEMPDGTMRAEEVTEFEVELGTIAREIRQHEGFVVGIQWWFHDMGDPTWQNDEKVYHRNWNMHTGPDYPNRIVLAVEDSIRVERVQPQLFDGKIYIHSVLNSPWGSYDVDTANIIVQLFDGSGNEVDLQHLDEPILRYSVDHDGHFKPVNATFPWDFTQEDLPPGEYSIRVTATNWQHTADAFAERTFNIREDMTVDPGDEDWEGFDPVDNTEESPALTTAGLLIGALLLVGIVSTRRRR